MIKSRNFWLWAIPAIVLWVAGFVVAAVWDLSITGTLYSPTNLFAILEESFGWYPAFLPALLLALLLLTRRGLPKKMWWQPVLCALVAAGGFTAIYYASGNYLNKRDLLNGPADPGSWLWLAAGVLFCVVLLIFVLRLPKPQREKLSFFARFGSFYMIANQVVVYLVKFVWGRPRFDDLLAAGALPEGFVPWYQPFGGGGSSFPSGHVANACGIFVLLILCDLYPAWNKRKKWVTALCWLYVAAMAFSRMMIGRHFLSDTLAASAIMAVIFYLMHNNLRYQNGLRLALQNAEAHREEGAP